jgi:DNA helicase HerA-like ATPase
VPLLFDFKHLGAQELKQIMGVSADQSQLYMSVVLNVLRKWEKRPKTANIPQLTFEGFEKLLQNEQELAQSQSVPLQQRLSLLRSFLKDADENKDLPYDRDVSQFFVRGCVVIADLTDPLISQSDANRIFQVVLSLFRKTSLDPSSSEPAAKLSGKLVVFDEAHKYISCKSGDLCDDVVYLVRQMRHYGIRIVVSTQVTFRIRTQHANNTDE